MRTYSLDFSAGEIIEFSLTAAFFLLLEDGGTNVNIEVATTGGNYSTISDVGAGFGFRAPHDGNLSAYTNLRFYSPVAQKIKFYAGNSEAVYNRLGGVVNVSGTISTRDAGNAFTNNFKSNSILNNGSEVIFTPASNPKGVILLSAQFFNNNSSTIDGGGFYARASAPTAITDSGCILMVDSVALVGTNNISLGSMKNSLKIPSGLGLFYFSANATTTCFKSAVWTVL